MAKIIGKIEHSEETPKSKFKYLCPACTGVAIETSNKMLGVEVDCQSCGKRVKLDDEKNYVKV